MVYFYPLDAIGTAAQAIGNLYLIILQTIAIDMCQSSTDIASSIWNAANSQLTQEVLIKRLVDLIIQVFTSDFLLDFSSIAFLGIMAVLVAINYSSVNEYALVDSFFRPATKHSFKDSAITSLNNPKSGTNSKVSNDLQDSNNNKNGIAMVHFLSVGGK